MFAQLLQRIEQSLFHINRDLSRGQRIALLLLRYPYALIHEIARGQLTLRAMSLVYTTLLSFVPLLALSFSILKGLGYHHTLAPALHQLLAPIGPKGDEMAARVVEFVDNVRGGVLGSLGLVFLLYTAISMVQKIEDSFNMVWRVQKPRSITRRISEYVSVLTIGPALIVVAIGLLSTLTNSKIVLDIADIKPFGTLLLWLGRIAPYLLVVGVFTFLYMFVPNTKVHWRAAVIGGSLAGVAWAACGAIFASFVNGTSTTILIYAGFAIVILALTWLYISWLILLLGAQLSFYVQHPQSLRPGSDVVHQTAVISERLAMSAMYLLAEDFSRAAPHRNYTVNSLAERLYVAVASLAPVLDRLEAAGLILLTENEYLIPGRDLASIKLTDILTSARDGDGNRALQQIRSVAKADAIATQAAAALRASVKDRTLKDLLSEAE